MGDLWREFNEDSRRHRNDKQEWSKELLQDWCTPHGIAITEIQPWHLRLVLGNKKLDIYPQRNRYFDLEKKKWGNFRNLMPFVAQFFGKKYEAPKKNISE